MTLLNSLSPWPRSGVYSQGPHAPRMLDLGPRRRIPATSSGGTTAAGRDVRGSLPGASEGRAQPKPAPEVPGILRNTPLTCTGLGRPGWRKIDQARQLATCGTRRRLEKREGARAVTGAVNLAGAAVNRAPASFGFGGGTRVVKRRAHRKFVTALWEVASLAW